MEKLFGGKLHLDWKIALITTISTLALIVNYYFSPLFPWMKWVSGWEATSVFAKYLEQTFLFFFVPIFIILLIFRENPREYGLTFGDWKAGSVITFGAIIFMVPILWLVGHYDLVMQNYYKPMAAGLPWNTLFDLFGWEFLFRGWLLFGYARKFGADALWLQAVPFALAHIGKPGLETLSTIFGGFAFGWVAWRTKSFVYPLLIHWFVASFIIAVTAGLLG